VDNEKDKVPARNSEETATDTMMRAMSQFGDEVVCVVVLTLHKNGTDGCLYSNCRSEPEMNGMLWGALEFQDNLADEEEDE
jgi:hypothetical protein